MKFRTAVPDLLITDVRADAEGRLPDAVRGRILAHLRKFPDVSLDVVIRQHQHKRSTEQNNWIWGVAYPLLADTLGYDLDEHDEMHYALVAKCFGTHHDERLDAEVPNKRSSKLTTKLFAEYMEWLVRFAARYGCVIPLPDEAVNA